MSSKRTLKKGIKAKGSPDAKGANKDEGKSSLWSSVAFTKGLVVFPLVSGFILASKTFTPDFMLFYIAFAVLLAAIMFSFYALENKVIKFNSMTAAMIYAGFLFLEIIFYTKTNNIYLTLVLAAAALLLLVTEAVPPVSIRATILKSLGVIVVMTTLAVLGTGLHGESAFLPAAFLGFIPSTVLAAAVIAKSKKIFIEGGWLLERPNEIEDDAKQKEPPIRPGKLAQLYSIYMFLGPSTAVCLVPAAKLPVWFLLFVFLLLPLAKYSACFMNETINDETLYWRTMHLCAVALIVALIAGLLARQVIV